MLSHRMKKKLKWVFFLFIYLFPWHWTSQLSVLHTDHCLVLVPLVVCIWISLLMNSSRLITTDNVSVYIFHSAPNPLNDVLPRALDAMGCVVLRYQSSP